VVLRLLSLFSDREAGRQENHAILGKLTVLRLICRYSGCRNKGHFVVWNKITPLSLRVLEIDKSMED